MNNFRKVDDIPSCKHYNPEGLTIKEFQRLIPSRADFIKAMEVGDCYAFDYFDHVAYLFMQKRFSCACSDLNRWAGVHANYKIETKKDEKTMTYYVKRVS